MVTESIEQTVDVLRQTIVALVRRDGPDLTARQLSVFLICYLESEAQTVRGLAARLNVAKPAITRALDRLAEFDLVRRKTDPLETRTPPILFQEIKNDRPRCFVSFGVVAGCPDSWSGRSDRPRISNPWRASGYVVVRSFSGGIPSPSEIAPRFRPATDDSDRAALDERRGVCATARLPKVGRQGQRGYADVLSGNTRQPRLSERRSEVVTRE
jgi:hypothetical protein